MDKRLIPVILSMVVVFFVGARDAEDSSLLKLTETLFILPSPTGYEEPMVEAINGILPQGFRSSRDNVGSLYSRPGKQSSGLAVCTPMDETGYFVSGINPEGYLRLDKAVPGPPLIDSFHLGHPMIVWTEGGPVEGVLSLPSLHILSSDVRKEFQERPSLELAYLDIGAGSEAEARNKGVAMLDAVIPWREITHLGGAKIAGHSLGLKFCAALVLDMAGHFSQSRIPNPTFVWMAQTKLPLRRSRPRSALGALRVSRELEADGIVIIDVFSCDAENHREIALGGGPVLAYSGEKGGKIGERIRELSRTKGLPLQVFAGYSSPVMNPFLSTHEEIIGLLLPVKFLDTPSEVVDTRDAENLKSLLLALLEEGRMR